MRVPIESAAKATRATPRKRDRAIPPPPESGVQKAAKPKVKRGRVVEDQSLWQQAARIGGGITPQIISSIIREADAGYTQRLIDLANECRQRDAHLQAVLSTFEESIAGLAWQIVPPKEKSGKPRSKDKRAAEWVEQVLRDTPDLRRLIADLAGSYYYGFSKSEIVWKKDDGGRVVPSYFVTVAHRRFKFHLEDSAHVLADPGKPEIVLEDAYPYKFICSYPRVTGDVPQREGLMRVLVWMSIMRNWVLFDWLKTGELSWKPWRIGTYKKGGGTSHEDREVLEEVMRRMTTDLSAVIPDSCSMTIEWPGGTGSRNSTHGELAKALGDEESKAVLGQTETTQSSSSSGYAQSKTHNEIRKDRRESMACYIASVLTQDLIGAMIDLNFGASVKKSRFEFITKDSIDLKAFSEALKNLRAPEVNAKISTAWAYGEAGIPAPTKGEEILGPDPGEEPQDPNKPGTGTDETPNPDEKPNPEEEDGKDPPAEE